MENKNKNKKGFTLIELLVVVAIMGLLAALAIISLNTARAKARDARRVADIKQIHTAIELYYTDQNQYPADITPSVIEGKCLNAGGFVDPGNCTTPVYMNLVPSNPAPRVDGTCSDSSYTYTAGTNNTTYQIRWCLGSSLGGIDAGPHKSTPAGLSN